VQLKQIPNTILQNYDYKEVACKFFSSCFMQPSCLIEVASANHA